jgi:thiol-disulfide isomerase/thioredoxin
MKKINQTICTAIALLLILASCNPPHGKEDQTAQICLQGKIINPGDNPLLAEFNHKTDSITVDSMNQFCHCIETEKPAYINMALRRIHFTVYANPGDTVRFTIDASKHNDPVEFHGDNAAASEFLYLLRTKKISHPVFNELLRQDSVEKFSDGIDKLQDSLLTALDDLTQTINDDYFTSLEKLRINYLLQNQKIRYYDYITGSAFPDSTEYFSFLEKTKLENPQALVLPEYINYLVNAFMLQLDDNPAASAGYRSNIKYALKAVKENIKNKEVMLALYNELLSNYAEYYGFDGLDAEYTWLKNNMTNENKLNNLEKLHATWEKISQGKKAPDFTYPDTNNDSISLSDFRGKLVYIDVWASWCGPCIYEIPHLDSLYHAYKDKNMVFLSISLDEKKSSWTRALKTHNMPWTQLHTGGWECSLCDNYNIKGIPHFILIDPKGKIISASAPRPSSEEIRHLFDKHSDVAL